MQADQTICKLGTPTQDGSSSLDGMKLKELSPTSKITESLMFLVAKMKKLETFKFGRRMDQKPNLGSLFTLLMLRKSKQRD
jgi:hypothetical protein